MSSSLFSFLCLALFITSVNSSPVKSIYISDTSCTFFYQHSNSTFTFQYCLLSSQLTYSMWNLCISNCCPQMPAGDYSVPLLSTLKVCKVNNNSESSSNGLLLVMTLIITLFGLVILVCLCVVLCRVCRILKKTGQVGNEQIKSVEWTDETEINDKLEGQLTWSGHAHKNN